MKHIFLAGLLGFSTLFCQEETLVGWQELPRITLFERGKVAVLESIATSIACLLMKAPRWAHVIMPSIGTCALGPSVVRGLIFKRKLALLQMPHIYDRNNFTDPLLYVNLFVHPLDEHTQLSSGASIWRAYNNLDDHRKILFAQGLVQMLDYDSAEEALKAVTQAKQYRQRQLHDLKKYSDIEEHLYATLSGIDRCVYSDDQFFMIDSGLLEDRCETVIDSGMYRQQVSFDTATKRITKTAVSSWYEDDYVYYYASWYGFELLQAYSRLLALERIWQS